MDAKAFFVQWELELCWSQHIHFLMITALSVLATAPRKQLVIISDCQSVVASGTNLDHAMRCKVCNKLWLFNTFEMTMTQLALVVRLSAAAP